MDFFKKPFTVFFSCVIGALFLWFSSVLFNIQVRNGDEYLKSANMQTYASQVEVAERGNIFDSNGIALTENIITYSIKVNPFYISKEQLNELITYVRLHSELEPKDNVVDELESLRENGGDSLVVFEGVEESAYKVISSKLLTYPSISFVKNIERVIKFPEMYSHIVGFLGDVSEEEVEEEDMHLLEKVGRYGLESYYNDVLKGEVGEVIYIKTKSGELVERTFREAEKGGDIVLSVDHHWQNLLFNIMQFQKEFTGAVGAAGIIINSNTGAVKSLVSLPGFDANLFNSDISVDKYEAILENPYKPMLNRVIGVSLSPGSTIKPLIAVGALEQNIVSSDDIFVSRGCINLDSSIRFCEADGRVLGAINISTAIARSSNLFFCNIGQKFNREFGVSRGIQYVLDSMDDFELEKLTGIDLPGEIRSTIPTPELMQKVHGRDWYPGDICNTVIGQGLTSITPIRLALMTSMISNGGEIYEPYLVKRVEKNGAIEFEIDENLKSSFDMSSQTQMIVKDGMEGTLTDPYGTARFIGDIDIPLIMKTGSADAREVLSNAEVVEGAHSWITGAFDYKGENFSFAVVQQFAGRGYKTVPIIGNFLSCLESEFEENCEARYVLPKEED